MRREGEGEKEKEREREAVFSCKIARGLRKVGLTTNVWERSKVTSEARS